MTYIALVHTVVETPEYLTTAKAAKMSEEERDWVVRYVSENPEAGALVQGAGGARKVRMPREGGGKSGGYRVATYYMDENTPVFLLSVIDKTEEANFSAAGKKRMRNIAKGEKKRRK